MVPAVLAISGVSAHACSHHRGCRFSHCVQVSARRMTPTCATGGPSGIMSDYRSLIPIACILVWCNRSSRLLCAPCRRSVPLASSCLSLLIQDREEPPSSLRKLRGSL